MKHKVKHGKYKVPINDSTYRHVVKLRVLGISAFVVYTLVAVLTAVFVYTNVYSAIGFVDLAALATIDTGAEVIDFQALETVESAWAEKHTATSTVFERNPFVPIATEEVSPSPTTGQPSILPNSPLDTSL